MPQPIGSIIKSVSDDPKPDPNGVATIDADTNSSVGDEGRTVEPPREPEILRGFESAFNPGTGGYESIDIGAGIDGQPKRKPGRQKGWKKQTETAVPSTIAELDFAAILVSGHTMLSALTGVDEFELEKKEGEKLSDALRKALQFHPAGISPEKLAYINLTFVLCEIYGTRAMAFRLRKMAERAKQPKPAPPTPINRGGQTVPAQAPAPPAQAAGQSPWYEPAMGDE